MSRWAVFKMPGLRWMYVIHTEIFSRWVYPWAVQAEVKIPGINLEVVPID